MTAKHQDLAIYIVGTITMVAALVVAIVLANQDRYVLAWTGVVVGWVCGRISIRAQERLLRADT